MTRRLATVAKKGRGCSMRAAMPELMTLTKGWCAMSAASKAFPSLPRSHVCNQLWCSTYRVRTGSAGGEGEAVTDEGPQPGGGHVVFENYSHSIHDGPPLPA